MRAPTSPTGLLPAPLQILLLGLLLPAGGCTWFKSNREVLITSDPAGAHVFLDGHDTGETTPYAFQIAGNFGSDHELELRRAGYRPERRHLYQHTEFYMTRWIDGAGPEELPPLPLSWTAGDFVFPFGVRGAIIPGEVYVKMYREDEPLLGFDVLRARAAAGTAPAGQ
ncbi:MAG: PEGA domain-containing protein [Planctomycetota bacterium]